ncbi:MAG: UvrD-helicase domain-containing protein [Gammaproteobacteria bacterium]|nr:UvrD-helicase domain-containing protein [Gammaproteobacteria bacterium]MDH5801395.1 UvrD-helicase domain-containing protein [Gammaproteobacteria bacterium]
MSHSSSPISPHISASVSASAGTGKTWMLVSRIIRLLLEDSAPDAILAITFTRKAAAEMQTRLSDRLFQLAACSETELLQYLQQIQAATDPLTLNKARWLYEDLLQSPQNIRTTTFHAFCQEILQRFPLEADVPPGFELLESTSELMATAWDLLQQRLTRQPESSIARDLEHLFTHCGSLGNTKTALYSFLEHRSDWWAYTREQHDSVAYAQEKLQQTLKIDPNTNPIEAFFDTETLDWVEDFKRLLALHPTTSNQKNARLLEMAQGFIADGNPGKAYPGVADVFLTRQGEVRSRKPSNVMTKKMGHAGADRFLEIHYKVSTKLVYCNDRIKRLKLHHASCAWYNVGSDLLREFQNLKAERRLLDFTDLEWKTYCLLNHSDNAHWIQYKLDQRINHLLIDEFQDTNPTQWHLIAPLLEELASKEHNGRSVFLVGDKKQSIYRFRRAAPELFDTAQDWIEQRLGGQSQTLATSRRSAPAIMQCVNYVFTDGDLHEKIYDFQEHHTVHENLWGHVELLPLLLKEVTEETTPAGLRNPLLQPRTEFEDTRHYREGCEIANIIQKLVQEQTPVDVGGNSRTMQYQDIMILLRKRSHSHAYEQALREAGIPYHSAQRGTLLESLEIRDLIALLQFLTAPYNNLSLATVLRSPIFSCSEQDLMTLANSGKGNWLARLQQRVESSATSINLNLSHAWKLLKQWIDATGTVPVHDLLDRIYTEANLLNRYQAAYPAHMKQSAGANLTRFIELALETDSGRYPSISRFLANVQMLQASEQDGPDEGNVTQGESKVRIMTIHASKGMEAPVVFLADAADSGQRANAYQALVKWPAQAEKPARFMLTPKKDHLDELTGDIINTETLAQQREEANLLYVALTRARQWLFISGSCEKPENSGWYGIIDKQLQLHNRQQPYTQIQSGVMGTINYEEPQRVPLVELDAALQNIAAILGTNTVTKEIAPSDKGLLVDRQGDVLRYDNLQVAGEADQLIRGRIIHRILQLLCENRTRGEILNIINNEYILDEEQPLDAWYTEANAVFTHKETRWIFDPTQYDHAHNEMNIAYESANGTVFGIIDRVIFRSQEALIIDYKSHPVTHPKDLQLLQRHYAEQLELYHQGIQQSRPELSVRSFLLFTHSVTLCEYA